MSKPINGHRRPLRGKGRPPAPSHVTSHAFIPADGVWWQRCSVCRLAEAAHERTTIREPEDHR